MHSDVLEKNAFNMMEVWRFSCGVLNIVCGICGRGMPHRSQNFTSESFHASFRFEAVENRLRSSSSNNSRSKAKVDLRIQRIPQDAVLEDHGRMTKIQELVDKLRSEYQAESIVADLGKKGKINRFSAASKVFFL